MIVVVGEIVGVEMIVEAGRIVVAERIVEAGRIVGAERIVEAGMITCYLWVRVLKMISVLSYLNRINPKKG